VWIDVVAVEVAVELVPGVVDEGAVATWKESLGGFDEEGGAGSDPCRPGESTDHSPLPLPLEVQVLTPYPV
jgi:hypothetical protein